MKHRIKKKLLGLIPKKAESVAYVAKLRRLKKYKNDRLYNRFNAQNTYYCNVLSFIKRNIQNVMNIYNNY